MNGRPRIYVASIADYNAGRLHGHWIDDCTDPAAVHDAITQLLAESTEPYAEEWAIHDFDGFAPVQLGEYESVEMVARLAAGITEHGTAYAAWAASLDRSEWDDRLDDFLDAFRGSCDSPTDFAAQLVDDMGFGQWDDAVPEWLRPYVSLDYKALARDLSADYSFTETGGVVYVFDAS